jgi:hypothetical protein
MGYESSSHSLTHRQGESLVQLYGSHQLQTQLPSNILWLRRASNVSMDRYQCQCVLWANYLYRSWIRWSHHSVDQRYRWCVGIDHYIRLYQFDCRPYWTSMATHLGSGILRNLYGYGSWNEFSFWGSKLQESVCRYCRRRIDLFVLVGILIFVWACFLDLSIGNLPNEPSSSRYLRCHCYQLGMYFPPG